MSVAAKHKEIQFEEAIELSLTSNTGGYTKGNPKDFDAELGLFPSDVLAFVQNSQPKNWQALLDYHGDKAGETLISTLSKELSSKGSLHVLRHGFKCFGKLFRLAYFAPGSKMNKEAWDDYEKNDLKIIRQVHHSVKNPRASLDVVLSVNGLPVVTVELKNPMSGQNVENGIRQYRYDRDPRDQIFKFKERALVHFAADPDLAFMATKLDGKNTFFLPFNKGHSHGAGNPPTEGKYRTHYLWDEVLAKDSLLDILARFIHLEVEEKQIPTSKGVKRHRKETMIFPRYHQLDAVRNLVANAKKNGSGHNYLVQHSAGSGKSNSIAWLAHRLSSLHDENDHKVFDTVVVITDRRVLDQQLQDTIYQFEHKQGVVQKIDENTQQLAKALAGGTPIIISTIQKFPFITQAIDTLEKKGEGVDIDTVGKRFAVIVDEAHSSQSGETATELRRILNKEGIEAAIAAEFLDEEDGEEISEEAQKEMMREMQGRPRQPNISFFAFTATPKYKTMALFNDPGKDGKPPFHHYSMRQAIEEGFIMDVLANYTTYKTYYGLIKSIENDPAVPKKKAAKAMARFMSTHPVNIAQKVEVIVEHFRNNTKHKIGGRAKAMVVTGSRLHAVKYKLSFDKYIEEKGYKDIKSLVAFSGTVTDPDFPEKQYTEVSMNNGIKEAELPEKFDSEEYQILLVAEKYQTGFDQPLLHTMYVDKRLSGIQAVQTLSRLNRTAPGKDGTFVLDFYNERDEIYKSFKPYYEITETSEDTDPHQLYDLQHRIKEWQIFDDKTINQFCEIWFRKRIESTAADHQKLNAILDPVVERYKELTDEDKDLLKGQLVSFRNLYGFLSQIIPYQDTDLEKLYIFSRFLLSKLPRRSEGPGYQVEGDVALKYYRLQKISEGSIDLSDGEADPLKGPTEVGTASTKDEEVALSMLIDKLNERFGTEFTPADQLFFDQVAETAIEDEKLQEAAKANTMENFGYIFETMLEKLFIDRMDGNEDIFRRLMNDDKFRKMASEHLKEQVYNRINE